MTRPAGTKLTPDLTRELSIHASECTHPRVASTACPAPEWCVFGPHVRIHLQPLFRVLLRNVATMSNNIGLPPPSLPWWDASREFRGTPDTFKVIGSWICSSQTALVSRVDGLISYRGTTVTEDLLLRRHCWDTLPKTALAGWIPDDGAASRSITGSCCKFCRMPIPIRTSRFAKVAVLVTCRCVP